MSSIVLTLIALLAPALMVLLVVCGVTILLQQAFRRQHTFNAPKPASTAQSKDDPGDLSRPRLPDLPGIAASPTSGIAGIALSAAAIAAAAPAAAALRFAPASDDEFPDDSHDVLGHLDSDDDWPELSPALSIRSHGLFDSLVDDTGLTLNEHNDSNTLDILTGIDAMYGNDPFDDGINPATGLPMFGGFDSMGNPYSFDLHEDSLAGIGSSSFDGGLSGISCLDDSPHNWNASCSLDDNW